MTVVGDKKKILLQREQIENFRLLGEAIKIWLGDLKNLVLTILLIISILSNGGNILLNAIGGDSIDMQYVKVEPSLNISEQIKNIENIAMPDIRVEDITLSGTDNNIIDLKNIFGFVITLILTVMLFFTKKVEKKNASTNTTTD